MYPCIQSRDVLHKERKSAGEISVGAIAVSRRMSSALSLIMKNKLL